MANDQKVFKMLEAGDLHLNETIPEGYMVMGLTRRGKTTLGHYLSGSPLKGIKDDTIKLVATTNLNSHAKIGLDHNSQTQIPNSFVIQKEKKVVVIIDCPGWEDSYGIQRVITNSYFNYRVFSKVEKTKFIVVFQRNDLGNTAQRFILTIKIFLETFKDYAKIKDKIIKSTVFVITKCNQELDDIKASIKRLLSEFKSALISNNFVETFKEFIMSIIQQNHIFLFKQAQDNVFMPTNNTLLKQIIDRTEFWNRKVVKNIVDMDEISFSVSKYIEANRNDPTYMNSLKNLMNIFQKRWEDVISHGVKSVFQQILEDTFSESESDQFLKKIDKFQKQRYKFFLPEEEKRREIMKQSLFNQENFTSISPDKGQSSLYWIRKMNLSQLIYGQMYKLSDQTIKRDIDTLINNQIVFMRIIQKICKVVKSTPQNKIIMNNYGYIVYRMFQEAKVLFLLFNNMGKQMKQQQFFDFHVPMKEAISSIFSIPFKEKKRKFALKYEIPKGQSPNHYREIILFMNSVDPGDQANHKILVGKQSRAIVEMSGPNPPTDVVQKYKSIKDLNQVRQNLYLQLKKSEDNAQRKGQLLTLFETMNRLGLYLSDLGNYDIAIKCFESVFNVMKVLETHGKKIDKEQDRHQKIKHLIKMSEYASLNFRMELAMQKLHEAYQMCKTYEEIEKVANLIFKYGNKYLEQNSNDDASRKYLKSMKEMDIYREFSEDDERQITTISNFGTNIKLDKSLK